VPAQGLHRPASVDQQRLGRPSGRAMRHSQAEPELAAEVHRWRDQAEAADAA
jgi:hypothetical protein